MLGGGGADLPNTVVRVKGVGGRFVSFPVSPFTLERTVVVFHSVEFSHAVPLNHCVFARGGVAACWQVNVGVREHRGNRSCAITKKINQVGSAIVYFWGISGDNKKNTLGLSMFFFFAASKQRLHNHQDLQGYSELYKSCSNIDKDVPIKRRRRKKNNKRWTWVEFALKRSV